MKRKRNRRKILAIKIKEDQAFISRPNTGSVFLLSNFYGYVELKDIRVIDMFADESRKYILSLCFLAF